MNIGILGTKLGMTQIFDESGLAIPVTIIKAGPCTVTQIKTKEIHGYNAIQIGYKEINQNKLTRSQLGHLKINSIESLKYLKEIKKFSKILKNRILDQAINLQYLNR
jgi:large subunit ribosomal protein L3